MTTPARKAARLVRRPSTTRFVLVAMLGPAVLAALLLWLNHEYDRSEAVRREVSASFDRRFATIELLSRLKDAETAQRGFIITNGDPSFLEAYEPARRAIARLLVQADSSSPHERQLSQRIAQLAAAKFREMDATIADVRRGDLPSAVRQVRDGAGKRTMDQLRALVGARIAAERRIALAGRWRFVQRNAATRRAALAGGIAAVVLVTALLFAGWRLRRARYLAAVAAFEAAERNQTVLDSTIDAMLLVNPSGTIESANAAATTMLGHPSAELARRDLSVVIDLAPGEGPFLQRVGVEDGRLARSFLADRVARRRDGTEIPVDVAIGAMALPSGTHLVVSLRDIAERKRLEQLKDDLMSTVSHELRTPLTSIVGSLGLLRAGSGGALPEAADRLVAIAETNSRRLIRLINDMLDIDRIEAGKLELRREPIDLRSLIAQAAHGAEGQAAAKGVRVAAELPAEPIIVLGDADRLLQVAANLLSNAVRFTPAEGVVRIALAETAGGEAVVTIDDQGPGVPPAFRSRIFGRFERAAAEAGAPGGAGLGLAISREIVVRHEGRIWFDDAPGGGARFAFSLPRLRPAALAEPGAARVLICEQDADLAGQLIAMAVKEGCAYELAVNAAAARAALARTTFDALLIDLDLPEEGGLAFAHAARIGPPPLRAPIIVVSTGSSGEGGSPAALDVVDWIESATDVARLGDALRQALARSGRDRPMVLHVDDDADLLRVVALSLQPEARILTATDLAAARAILATTTPDAVILDLALAEGSGLDLAPLLVDADGVPIPTILYSAQDVSADLAGKVDAVLVKARGSLPDLKAALRRIVAARAAGRSADA